MDNSGDTYRARLMRAASDFVYARHRYILLGAVAVTALMYWSYTRLELKLNFIDMLSREDPTVVQYRHAVEQFGALSYLFVVLEVEDPADLGRAKEMADELARRLPENQAYVPRVFHKIEIQDYLDDALLYLDPPDLAMLSELAAKNRDALVDMLNDPGLASSVETADRALASYTSGGELPEFEEGEVDFNLVFDSLIEVTRAFRDYGVKGPGGQFEQLRSSFLKRGLGGAEDLPVDVGESYFVDRSGRRLLLFVSSAEPAENFEWCREFMEYVDGVEAEISPSYPEVKALKTGNAAFMRDDNRILREDMAKTTAVAFVCIMALFAVSFRNISSIVMVGVPLAAGILWALGAANLTVGHLTPVTAIFGAILLGLGIDYAILILSRYTEERHLGKSIKEALDVAMVETGASILTGALATAAAFFSMTLASFKAGQEMGIIAGTGIILFVIIMTLVLGSLLVAWDKARESAGPTQRKLNPFIMRGIGRLVDRHALAVFLVLLAGLAYLAYRAPGYEFEYNYLELEPENVESFELVQRIPDWFDIDVNYGMVISRTVEEDREIVAALKEKKETVSKVQAISDFIPEDQGPKLDEIRKMEAALSGLRPADLAEGDSSAPLSGEELDRLMAALRGLRDTVGAPGRGLVGLFYLAEMAEAEDGARRLLSELDGLIADFESADRAELRANLGRLDRRVASGIVDGWDLVEKMVGTEGVTVASLSRKHPDLVERHRGRDGTFMIYAFPSKTIWQEENLKAVAGDLREVSELFDTEAMGVAILFERILGQIKSDLFRVASMALVSVFVVLLINYRGLWHTLLSLIPLVAGGIAMVGMMSVRGQKFNIINTGMLPLIIGIGVDYGVYIVHRYICEGKGTDSVCPAVESTGRAVTLSAFTTVIGFSAIILAQWRGLSMMGATLGMGIGLCWVAAVFFLPSILKLIEKVKERRGGARPPSA